MKIAKRVYVFDTMHQSTDTFTIIHIIFVLSIELRLAVSMFCNETTIVKLICRQFKAIVNLRSKLQ